MGNEGEDRSAEKDLIKLLDKMSDMILVQSRDMVRISNALKNFIEGVDGWIKDVNKKMEMMDLDLLNENTDNIQHNYELIYEIKDQLEEQKQELNALKLVQIVSLKKEKENRIKD